MCHCALCVPSVFLCVKLHFGAYCDGGNFWLSGAHTYTHTHSPIHTYIPTYIHTNAHPHTKYFTQYAQYTSSHKLKSGQEIGNRERGKGLGLGAWHCIVVALQFPVLFSCACFVRHLRIAPSSSNGWMEIILAVYMVINVRLHFANSIRKGN